MMSTFEDDKQFDTLNQTQLTYYLCLILIKKFNDRFIYSCLVRVGNEKKSNISK